MSSIAMSCNVYNDALALRGMLEMSATFFDELFVVHSGPNGAYSTDGTIELCEQFNVKLVFDEINKGFGHIRSRLIHEHGCEWAMILDADERFYPATHKMICHGDTVWDINEMWKSPGLSVEKQEFYNAGGYLKDVIGKTMGLAILTSRRHWLDFSFTNPTQNWLIIPDFQLRIVRNSEFLEYDRKVLMHERLIDTRTGVNPEMVFADQYLFHDHFHPFFRKINPGHKEFNELNYRSLEGGKPLILQNEKPE